MNARPQTRYDVAIIGGGASGLAAAIAAGRAGASVCVLERDVACGLPILATGNGRCNLSNARLDSRRYYNAAAAKAVLGRDGASRAEAFFDSLGLMTCEVEGRLYPITRRAETVRDCLLRACERLGVDMRCGVELQGAALDSAIAQSDPNVPGNPDAAGGAWILDIREPQRPVYVHGDQNDRAALRRARKTLAGAQMAQRQIRARSLVIAVGGCSHGICDMLAIPHVDEEPVLCPIAGALARPGNGADAGDNPLDALDGLRLEAMLALKRKGACIAYEEGEVLLRPYGISGIAAFNLSRRCQAGDLIEMDLFPAFNNDQLAHTLRAREQRVGPWNGETAWFDGVLPRALAAYVCEYVNGTGDAIAASAALLHRITLRVTGTCEHQQAQVRRGGIPFSSIDADTVAVTSRPHLFACGEALDQDADCGGYNLGWAWLSGLRAGEAASR